MAAAKTTAPTGYVTLYKKKEGVLSLSLDQKALIWGPPNGPPSHTIIISDIANLQQTPPKSAKVILKVIPKSDDPYLFQFTSQNARAEADVLKNALSNLIQEAKEKDPSIPRPAPGPATLTAARWMDDNALKTDIELQKSLMKKEPSLHALYMEGLGAKADNMTDSQWNAMFWSTRIGRLRVHAFETEQRKGYVNILSVVKPKTVDGELKLNMSVEQTQQIFEQHPLVRQAYDEIVPRKLSQGDFWSRFFLSKLSKRLRGEKITNNDAADAIFDRYLEGTNSNNINDSNSNGIEARLGHDGRIPRFIDLEGNEEDQGGFKGGNRPDLTMRPGRENRDLVQSLNSISSKIMANVSPTDVMESSLPPTDTELAELALRDLQNPTQPHVIPLQVDLTVMAQAQEKLHPPPASTLSFPFLSTSRLTETARTDEKRVRMRILEVSPAIEQKCRLTHAACVEFKRQFWTAFHSGDPDRAVELEALSHSLRRSKERIAAVANEAELEWQRAYDERKAKARELYKRTGQKIFPKKDLPPGGRDAVLAKFRMIMEAIDIALERYKQALEEEGLRPTVED